MTNIFKWVFLISPLFSFAQSSGIVFEHGLSWEEVLQKAEKENKYVFVDCFTSWSGPCKWMDKNVYPMDSVGKFINEKFISIRIQMDTTKLDADYLRHWYSTAHDLGEKYDIRAYPSYLFFAPDGQAVHKDIGRKNAKEFLAMASAATDSQKEFYTLLIEYRKKKLPYPDMPFLADAAERLQQDSISQQVSRDYIQHYLTKSPEMRLWTKENILFVGRHTSSVMITDDIFQLYYNSRLYIDSVMHEAHFSDGFINYILYRDEIDPSISEALKRAVEPKWHSVKKRIKRKFDIFYVNKNILEGRIEYYKDKRRWNEYIKYFVELRELEGIEKWNASVGYTYLQLDNDAYEVFKYDNNKRELKKALSWINRALAASDNPFPEAMDTKANLLYKIGKKSEGFILEEKSHALAPRNPEITTNYEKMKNNLSTWSTE